MPNATKPISKIGEILIQWGMVTPNELEEALVLAKDRKVRLGEALVKLGVLGEDQLVWALGIQFDLTHVELHDEEIDWDLLMSLPIERLQGLMVLPIAPQGSTQRVVIADPTIAGLKEFIEELFPDRQVLVQLASPHEMDEVFEEVSRRRYRARVPGVSAPWTPPPANALVRWVTRLESRRIERVVVAPTGHEEYSAVIIPGIDATPEKVSGSELKRIIDHLYGVFTCESPSPFVTFGLRTGGRAPESSAIRAVVVNGIGGSLLALQGIASEPARGEAQRVTVLTGSDPLQIKSALLAEMSALVTSRTRTPLPLVISLEAYVDFAAKSIFQAEITDPQLRLAVCRPLLGGVQPAALILELESEEDLSRLPSEAGAPGSSTLFVLVRGLARRGAEVVLPQGVERITLPNDSTGLKRKVQELVGTHGVQ